MTEKYDISEKVYPTKNIGALSMLDMLTYFEQKGVMRVSDLHIKIKAAPTYRIDGELVKLKGPPVSTEIAEKLIYPLLNQKKIEKLNKDFSVDSSYKLGNLQFRINVFIENDGICAAVRALSMDIPKIENIGFPNSVWEDIIELKHGLVLLTGITGAGKSTTIASLIERISQKRACRIFSVEDPDIIFVGEMRDPETISMTLMAAETGHLVFSTLHTRDTVGSITRILDYFPPGKQHEVQNQLSLGLKYIVSQKLIPKKDGSGRLVAMEILNNNYAAANIIRTGKIEQMYSQLQIKTQDKPDEKMITLEKHLAMLVKQDKIDINEARKWVNKIKSFVDAMQHD